MDPPLCQCLYLKKIPFSLYGMSFVSVYTIMEPKHKQCRGSLWGHSQLLIKICVQKHLLLIFSMGIHQLIRGINSRTSSIFDMYNKCNLSHCHLNGPFSIMLPFCTILTRCRCPWVKCKCGPCLDCCRKDSCPRSPRSTLLDLSYPLGVLDRAKFRCSISTIIATSFNLVRSKF